VPWAKIPVAQDADPPDTDPVHSGVTPELKLTVPVAPLGNPAALNVTGCLNEVEVGFADAIIVVGVCAKALSHQPTSRITKAPVKRATYRRDNARNLLPPKEIGGTRASVLELD
jgi:hypothetical protein